MGTVEAEGLGAPGQPLTMEGPQVIVSEVHQVLQGGVKLLHDALGAPGQRERGRRLGEGEEERWMGRGKLPGLRRRDPVQPQRGVQL